MVDHGSWLTWLAVSTNPDRLTLNMQAGDVDRLSKSLRIVGGTQDKLIQLPPDLDSAMPSRRANKSSQLEMHGQANLFARFLQYAVYLGSNNLLDEEQTDNIVKAITATKSIQLLEQILQGQGPTARMLATGLLVSATKIENYQLVQTLLKNGGNPNAFCHLPQTTPLQLAVKAANPTIVKLLVDSGADPNRGIYDASPLSLAIQCTCIEETSVSIIKILLDAEADANDASSLSPFYPPLFGAIIARNAAAVRLLIVAGASVNRVSESLGTALGLATKLADIPMIRLLLEVKADVNLSWEDIHAGKALLTPIQVAAGLHVGPALEIAHILLSAGANVNPHDCHRKARTPLQIACEKGNSDMAELLLNHGANINPIAHNGHTPLQAAIMNGHQHVTDLLLERGAEINAPASSEGGRTALQAAAKRGDLGLVLGLLMRGGDIHGEAAWLRGLTTLQAAASSGNIRLVELLLQLGERVNRPISNNGVTELQAAVRNGHVEVVRSLLLAGANVHAEAHMESLLTLAIRHRHMDVFEALLAVTDPNFPPHRASVTPLLIATERCAILTVDCLLMAGAEVNALSTVACYDNCPDGCKATPLMAAASVGNVEVMSALIKAGAAVNPSLPKEHRLPLHAAVRRQSISAIQLLLSHNADPNQIEPRTGYRPLHVATKLPDFWGSDQLQVVQVLLRGGAKVNEPSCLGEMPLHCALASKEVESLLPIMIRAGANVNTPSNGIPPIHVLGTLNLGPDLEETLIRILIDAGADINSSSNGDRTALQNAVRNKNSNVVRLLLDKNADVNAPSTIMHGRTALQAAAENGDLPLVEELFARGADINALPAEIGGATALQLAAFNGHFSVAVFLAKNGANISAPAAPDEGRTALEGAAEYGRLDMVHFLLENDNDDGTIEARCESAARFAEREGHLVIAEILRAWKKL